ncbi:TonB-dependent receptor domain-containing protein [Pyxidicoccus xibeiensis]|uniref:TonB-dependent receptor domain-containing protein n=1 Tax=Pyxidicoccus xibeiensis TaxID=2906759 RepID=UPI0020A7BB64|nr:TonB-dependent receptor [Pyxidicoccus xibeiensis]MCP3143507.1 TonB-dependent receptor [Pyxidicoccus xibeiensis]
MRVPLLLAVLLSALLALPGISGAQAPPSATSEPRAVEVDVQVTDAGTAVSQDDASRLGLGAADGGVWLQPPVLSSDSPAAWPEGLVGAPGEVKLELVVDEQGAVTEVKVVEAPPEARLTEAALKAAPGLRFSPAKLGDRAVSVRLPFVYRFEPPAALAFTDARLTGEVRARGTRRPLADAALFLDGSTEPATLVDAQGRFTLEVAPGTHRLEVRAPGHKSATFEETLSSGQSIEVVYRLQPGMVNPYETVVRDDRPRTEVTRITLHEQELREVPGTQGDPFKVIMLMPGVASVASGLGYPVVRGGQPASTGYFLDGVRVPMLYHLLLGPAVIHPDFIDTIDFHPGTPPVQYGRLMGGAVEGRLSKPREDRLHVTAYADLVNSGGFIEYPFESTGTSVTVAGRYSYMGLLIPVAYAIFNNEEEHRLHAGFWDYQVRVEQKVGQGRLRVFALGSSDDVGEGAGNYEGGVGGTVTSAFHRVDLRGTHPLAGGEGELGFTVGLDEMGVEGEQMMVNERLPSRPLEVVTVGKYGLNQVSFAARAGWKRPVGESLELHVGGDVEHRRVATDMSGTARPPGWRPTDEAHPLKKPSSLGTLAGAFAAVTWRPSERWVVLPGARVDSYHLVPGITHVSVEPRVSVRHTLTEAVTLKGGGGVYRQAPTILLHLPAVDAAGLRYGLQEGAQFDVGAEWKVAEGLELSGDVFYNPLWRTVEFDVKSVLENRQRRGLLREDPAASGYTYGLDLMVRHPLSRHWFGWATYSFVQSKRHKRFPRYADNATVEGMAEADLPFAFEQAHVVNAAISYKLGDNWTLGTVVHFNTGRPESGEISSVTQREGMTPDKYRVWVREDADRVDRLRPFFRVDFRAAKSWAMEDFNLEAYLDILNLSLQQEVFAYEYTRQNGKLKRESIGVPVVVPLLGLKGSY